MTTAIDHARAVVSAMTAGIAVGSPAPPRSSITERRQRPGLLTA